MVNIGAEITCVLIIMNCRKSRFEGRIFSNDSFFCELTFVPNTSFRHPTIINQSNVIEATFLHYFVPPRDEPSLRFLWRKDATSDVKSFLYTRYIFGARVSTTCANFALQQTAMDNNECFPKAFKAVLSTSTRMVTRFHSKNTITQ